MRLTAFTLAILLLGAVFGPTQARAAQAAGSPAADGYRAVYTDRELLDHDYIQQWWQHVNDLFHRTGTMFLSGKREVRVDVTFQGYEYTRALKAMQGFEARLSPDEAAAAFLDSLRPGAMTFNVSAYLESGRLGPKEGPLLQGIWLVSDGKRLPARRVRIVRRGKQGQSLVVDAEFPPIQAAREPWITLGFATGGPRPASGHVLFPVDLLRATPAPGSARGKSGRSLDSQEATTPLTPVAEAAPAEPAPKAYSRQELSDAQYIESWWRRTRESHSRSYGSLDWVGNQVLVDAAYESREFTRALCATEGYQKRQSDAEIEGSFRRRYQPKEVAFQVRFSNAIWP
ncbi:MAG: hypothetical protein HY303_21880, partial [Candidatus Wallbacteria bacterium]|nr:hypothetical protein [Candidatus Wallbacteria bacterium]